MDLILRGTPHAKQIKFFKAKAPHIAYGGARGGGKSWAMRRKFLLLALRYPGLKLLLLRRTLGELRENHINHLIFELYGIVDFLERERVFNFPNGSRLKMGYCDDERDVFQYQGQEYDVIGLEEATHFTEFQRDFLTTCNRTTRNDFSPRMYYTANPGGIGHAWFKRIFIDREFRPEEREGDYVFVPARVFDNVVLMENNPTYVDVLRGLPEHLRRAHLYGDWDALEGQYFHEFRRDKHVVEPFNLPHTWRRFRSLDYGLDMTACYWWAVDERGACYVYRELYKSGLTLTQTAREICALTSPDEEIGYTVASPDLWNSRQETGKSGVDLMASANLLGLVQADSSRIAGWRVVREYLSNNKLFIFSNCTNLIRSLPQLQFDKFRIEDASSQPHEITHAPESMRYGLMSRPLFDAVSSGTGGDSGFYTPGETEEWKRQMGILEMKKI